MIEHFKDPLTKNHQLSSYCNVVQDGYNSEYTANTNNTGGTFVFAADIKFDANAPLYTLLIRALPSAECKTSSIVGFAVGCS